LKIPGSDIKLVEDLGLEHREVPAGPLEEIIDLEIPESVDGPCGGGQGGEEEELGRFGGIARSILFVKDFRLGGAFVADVVGDRLGQALIDGSDLGGELRIGEIDVIGMNELEPFGPLSFPETGDDHLHEADDAACLLESLVLLETAEEFSPGRMEGIGIEDILVEAIGRA
jgi:hypothetical protein